MGITLSKPHRVPAKVSAPTESPPSSSSDSTSKQSTVAPAPNAPLDSIEEPTTPGPRQTTAPSPGSLLADILADKGRVRHGSQPLSPDAPDLAEAARHLMPSVGRAQPTEGRLPGARDGSVPIHHIVVLTTTSTVDTNGHQEGSLPAFLHDPSLHASAPRAAGVFTVQRGSAAEVAQYISGGLGGLTTNQLVAPPPAGRRRSRCAASCFG
jgi:hypothetical protein